MPAPLDDWDQAKTWVGRVVMIDYEMTTGECRGVWGHVDAIEGTRDNPILRVRLEAGVGRGVAIPYSRIAWMSEKPVL